MTSGSATLNFTGSIASLVAGASGTIVHSPAVGFPAGIVRVASITTNTGSGTCTVTLSATATATFSSQNIYFVAAGTTHVGADGGSPGGGGGGGGAGTSDGGVVQCAGANGGNGGAGAAIIETYW